ncbi:MAG: YIP1 family protein [Burkholderiales bacterium]
MSLLRPDWAEIAHRRDPVARLWLRIALPYSAGVGIALYLGSAIFNRDWHQMWGYSMGAADALRVGLGALSLSAAAPLVLAAVMQRLARMYRQRPDYAAAFRVAVHAARPLWLAGLTLFLMPMFIVGMLAALISLSQCGAGACALLGIKQEESTEFVGISILVFAIVLSRGGMTVSSLGLL